MKKALFCDKCIDYFKLNLENKRIKDTPAVAGVHIFMTYLILHLTRESFSLANHFFFFFDGWSCYFLDSVVCSGMANQIEKEIRSPSSRIIWTLGPHRNRIGYVRLSYRFCFMSVNQMKVCYVLENLKVWFVSLRLCFQMKLWQSLCVALYDLLRCSNWCLALY